jgi:hypothetical protein
LKKKRRPEKTDAFLIEKADDGNRTRLPSLGSWYSTDELHLRFVFYYSTFLKKVIRGKRKKSKIGKIGLLL